MVRSMRAAIVKVSLKGAVEADAQVFSTKYSLTLPAPALEYIQQVLIEVRVGVATLLTSD